MGVLMTPAEYARHRKQAGLSGGTPQAVQKAVDSGRITVENGKIDAEAADLAWKRRTRPRIDLHSGADLAPPAEKPEKPADPGDSGADWAKAKARDMAAVASMRELELAKRQNELVDRAGVERAAHAIGRQLNRTLVEVWPSKVSVDLAAITDPWEVECFLREQMRTELGSVAMTPSER